MMQVYGYPFTNTGEKELVQLLEVSIAATPETLRMVASFLQEVATEIDSGKLQTSHIHIETKVRDWKKTGCDVDIIVLNTNYSEPSYCLDTECD